MVFRRKIKKLSTIGCGMWITYAKIFTRIGKFLSKIVYAKMPIMRIKGQLGINVDKMGLSTKECKKCG